MGIKCNQPGCPHDYECCCYECEEVKNANIDVIDAISQLSVAKKQIEEQEKTMKEKLVEAMEAYGVTKFENEAIKITYYAPSQTTTIDSKRLKEEKPEIAKEYSKTSSKKSYVKIEVKAGDK